jgi:hypothetical protein
MNRRTLALTLLILAAALVAIAASSTAQTDPVPGQDWVVQDNTFWDKDLLMTTNITVNSSGSLKLDNMTLTMMGLRDGELRIFVEAGSSLEIVNTNVRSSNSDIHYWFECRGKVIFDGANVRDVASNTSRWDKWDGIGGGVQIYDGSSVLRNSDFHDSQRINVYVEGCSPEITNSNFYNAEYVSTYQRTAYNYQFGSIYGWYADATGLYLNTADPNITRCTFRNNGLRNTAHPFYSTSYPVNVVATYGRGILAYDSSPNITLCEFRENGDQPADRVVAGIRQHFFEQIYYSNDKTAEGGLVCVGTSHPGVYDSGFYTNDVFGIYGFDGGYPSIVESSRIEGTRYLRDTSVNAPSAGIQVDQGSGTMVVANSTASSNLVLANIYLDALSLRLINFTNSNNVVSGAYNIYVSGGSHYFEDSYLDGSPELQMNLYVGYSRSGTPKLRFENCVLNGADFGMYNANYQGATVTFANSTIINTRQATFYLQSTNVDCINCTINPLRVESYSYGRGSTVRIMYYLSIEVTWQNGRKVPGAFVQVFNASKDFVYGDIADANGTLGPLVVVSRTIYASSGQQNEVSNSPLYMGAYSAGLQSIETKHVFTTNKDVTIEIEDDVSPTIYIFTPTNDHPQNTTSIEVRGMSTDVGAGINSTYVSIDEEDVWTLVAEDQQTWDTMLELAEGTHTIHVKSVDHAGNEAIADVVDVVVDLTPPLLEVVDPVKAVWYTSQENYTIRGKVNGHATLIVNRQEVEVAPDGTWESFQEIHSGTNEFRITATDRVGNAYVITKSIVRDSSEPKLILTSPEEGLWTNISQIEVKGITELGATILVNGDPLPTFDGRFATNIYLTEGANRVIIEAVDKANNLKREERWVYLDSIPPALQVESPRADALVSQRFLPVTGTIDDPSVTHVIINGLLIPVTDQRFHKEFRLDEGDNPIVIEVWDGARNYVTRNYMIVLDTTPPDLVLLEPTPGLETLDPTVRIRGTVDADVEMVIWGEPLHEEFDIINLVRLSNTFRFDQYPLVNGVNTIHLEAEDDVGNLARMTFQVIYDLDPPVLMISPMVERTTREVVTVSGIVLDGAEIRINGVPGVLGPNGEFAESIHLQSGKNAIKLVAFDEAGNRVESTVNVTRTAVEPPSEGIAGAGIALSLVLVLIMLVIGMAILYPGIKGGTINPEAMVGEPIIIDESGDVVADSEAVPTAPPWQTPEEPRGPPSPPPDHRRPPPPPPGYQAPPQQQSEPPAPEETGTPPKPPWRD